MDVMFDGPLQNYKIRSSALCLGRGMQAVFTKETKGTLYTGKNQARTWQIKRRHRLTLTETWGYLYTGELTRYRMSRQTWGWGKSQWVVNEQRN